jgi:hypothetical protein
MSLIDTASLTKHPVTAKIVLPLTVRDVTVLCESPSPELMAVQLVPLFVDRKSPPVVPTKILLPLTASGLAVASLYGPIWTHSALVVFINKTRNPIPRISFTRYFFIKAFHPVVCV